MPTLWPFHGPVSHRFCNSEIFSLWDYLAILMLGSDDAEIVAQEEESWAYPQKDMEISFKGCLMVVFP